MRARRGRNVRALRSVLLTYAMYNFDLGYVQVKVHVKTCRGRCPVALHASCRIEGAPARALRACACLSCHAAGLLQGSCMCDAGG